MAVTYRFGSTQVGRKPGSSIGVGIVVVGVIVFLGWLVLAPSAPTEPTPATTAPGRLDRIDAPDAIWKVADKPTGRGLAADDYNKGVVEYYDSGRYAQLGDRSPERVKAIGPGKFPYRVHKFITVGAKKRRMRYVENYISPPRAVAATHRELIDGEQAEAPPLPHLPAFAAMAEASLLYGKSCERKAKGGQAEAERLYKAVLIFGRHVTDDRVRLRGLQIGLKIQQDAARHLAALYESQGQAKKLSAARKLLEDLAAVIAAVDSKAGVTVLRTDKKGRLHPGDLRHVIANDMDPMWRVEAIRQAALCLASLGKRKADYVAMTTLLEQCKADENPFIRAAAEAAPATTQEDTKDADERSE
jgi:hypothetical protein